MASFGETLNTKHRLFLAKAYSELTHFGTTAPKVSLPSVNLSTECFVAAVINKIFLFELFDLELLLAHVKFCFKNAK